jgi:tripartite-type tricarboxylate transporter receptor subunit TctC
MRSTNRRDFLHLAASGAVLTAAPRAATAQAYPTRPVRLVVGFAAGGTADILARLLAQRLSEQWKQQVVVENKPGGGTNIAVQAVVNSPPDGCTLPLASSGNTINATLYDNLPFNFLNDVAPVAALVRGPIVLVVHPSIPANTVAEFVTRAKTNPGKLNFGSSGVGSSLHLSGELFKYMGGVDLLHVPYRGEAPALTDMISGQLQSMFTVLGVSLQHIRSGAVRPLGVTTATRFDVVSDVPAIGETLPGYDTSVWYGVGAPKGTPSEIVNKLNADINEALANPRMKSALADMVAEPIPGSPVAFRQMLVAETEKWAKVIKASGTKPG